MRPYIRLPKVPLVRGRQGFILDRCRGRRVLHLGCVDAGFMHERFERGELMHQRLAQVAGDLWGVDIDAGGIGFLRDHGFDNLAVGDICALDAIEGLPATGFDVIVASEVVEHLINPGLFLTSVQSLMVPGVTELIVTVPNAFRVATLISLLRGVEYVHPDHNYWFSYHTATNLLRKCGLRVANVLVYSFQTTGVLPVRPSGRRGRGESARSDDVVPPGTDPLPSPHRRALRYLRSLPRRLIVSVLYRTTAFWGDGLIIVATLPTPAEAAQLGPPQAAV